jgi:hypothetical protein
VAAIPPLQMRKGVRDREKTTHRHQHQADHPHLLTMVPQKKDEAFVA